MTWLLALLITATPAALPDALSYVKIVDRGGFTDSPASPGADIDAIEVIRDGTVVANGAEVVDSQIGKGLNGNAASDPREALGGPDHPSRTLEGFVALGGPGNHIVLRLDRPAQIGDLLRVHEMGSVGGRAEHTEVCIATSPLGPWIPLGSGWGVFDLIVGEDPPADPKSACQSPPLT